MNIEAITGITLFIMFLIIMFMVLYLLYSYVTEVDDKIDDAATKFVSKSSHETDIDASKKEDKILHKRIDNTFDGKYESLEDKPTLFDGKYESLEDKPVLFDGKYESLEDKPTLFDGKYESLTGDKSNHMHTTDQITGLDDYFDTKYPDISTFPKMIDSKADVSHKHDYLGINGLSEQLDNKANAQHKHTMEDLELSKNPAYKLDINGNARLGRTEIYEKKGTWGGENEGSLVLSHGDPGGASSITFKSTAKGDSGDSAYIRYQDTLTKGGPGERSRLVIGVTNDRAGKHKDDILLQPSGGVGIGVNDPRAKLHINGSQLVEGNMTINNNAPTLFLQDKNHKAGALHVNSDKMYLLSSSGVNKRDWKSNNGAWPAVFNLKNNNAHLGGGLHVKKGATLGGGLRVKGTTLTNGNMTINNNAPTLFLQDKNHKAGALHVNSGKMYLLSSSGVNKRNWKSNNGEWPAVFNLKNNDARFGGNVTTKGSINGLTPQQMAFLAKNTPSS